MASNSVSADGSRFVPFTDEEIRDIGKKYVAIGCAFALAIGLFISSLRFVPTIPTGKANLAGALGCSFPAIGIAVGILYFLKRFDENRLEAAKLRLLKGELSNTVEYAEGGWLITPIRTS